MAPSTPTRGTRLGLSLGRIRCRVLERRKRARPGFSSAGEADLRHQRARLGPRRRHGQWGAYGYAQHGLTYDKILAHYYTGTTLGPAPVARVRVLLAEGRRRLTLGPMRRSPCATGWASSGISRPATRPSVPARDQDDRRPATAALPAPLHFLPGSSPLRFGDTPYRGQLLVSVGQRLAARGQHRRARGLPLGVVPSEMPNTWLPEALKAQAVAARSYALAVRKTSSWFDLYADTRSQVYLGIAHEKPSTTAAVQATAGEVVLYEGRVATTYFYSSSGGRTAAATMSGRGRRCRTSSPSTTPTTRSRRITAGDRLPSLPDASTRCCGRPDG